MSFFHFLPATLADLRTAVGHVEQTLVHLSALHQILNSIRLRMDGHPQSMTDIGSGLNPAPLLFRKQPKFGRTLRRMREALGWTREQLAHLSGLATSTIRNLETRANLSLAKRVRHHIVIALASQSRFKPRRNKPRA